MTILIRGLQVFHDINFVTLYTIRMILRFKGFFAQKISLVSIYTTIALLSVLIASEVVLRIWNPVSIRLDNTEILLPRNKTTTNVYPQPYSKISDHIVINKNSLGFRGPEPPVDFSNYLSVITVGGSTTECIFITEGETWTDELSTNLSPYIGNLWLNNAGIDGHSSFGHIELLKQYLSNLKPTMALFLVGINDLAIDSGRLYDEASLTVNSSNFQGVFQKVARHSYILTLIKNTTSKKGSHELTKFTDTILDYNVLGDPSNASPLTENDISATNNRLMAFRFRLTEIVRLSRQSGIYPVLITQPAVYGFGDDPETGVDLEKIPISDFTEDGIIRSGRDKWILLEMYNDVTREIGKTTDTPVIDLATKLSKNSKYYYDFIHFTEVGAQEVADIIAPELCAIVQDEFPNSLTAPCPEIVAKQP